MVRNPELIAIYMGLKGLKELHEETGAIDEAMRTAPEKLKRGETIDHRHVWIRDRVAFVCNELRMTPDEYGETLVKIFGVDFRTPLVDKEKA